MCRKTAAQTKGDEQGPVGSFEMRESAPSHGVVVWAPRSDSPGPGGLRGRRRPRACPTVTQTRQLPRPLTRRSLTSHGRR
jgi:hypothetical protein